MIKMHTQNQSNRSDQKINSGQQKYSNPAHPLSLTMRNYQVPKLTTVITLPIST